MVGTILPIVNGERSRHGRSWTIAAFSVGAVSAGGTLGLLLGSFPPVVGRTEATSIVAVAGGLLVARAAGVISFPLPQRRKQVPQWWSRSFRGPKVGLLYGWGLGLGFLTYIPVTTFYLVVLWVTLALEPWEGGVVLGLYGLGRGLPLIGLGGEVAGDGAVLERVSDRLLRLQQAVYGANDSLVAGLTGMVVVLALVDVLP